MLVARRSFSGARRRTGAVFTETFPGADGSDWSGQWTNKRVTTDGVVDIQSSRGHLGCGTVAGYQGKAGMMSTASFSDMNLTGDYIVASTVTECFPMFGFRSSGSWSPIHASALNSYWVEFMPPSYGQFILFRRINDTPTTLGTAAYTFAANDVVHFRIVASGPTISVRLWKNSEPEPPNPQISVDDTSHTSGRLFATLNGGNDGVADHAYFDNITVSSGTPPVEPPPPPATSATVRIGATWTDTRPSPTMDVTIASHPMQMQHMIEFGAGNPWPTQASMSAPQWTQLDPYMQDLRDAGATEKVLCFHKAPGWMKTSGNTSDDNRPTNANFDNFATISAQAAARYTDFQWGMIWNEYKAFWNNTLNRPDYENFTIFYNKVYAAVKAVRPTMKLGGPYATLISSEPGTGSHPSSVVTFPGGQMDQRWLDAFAHFVNNCDYDFLSWDGGIGHAVESLAGTRRFGGHDINNVGTTPDQQIAKLPNLIAWIRGLSAKANTVPIIVPETYMQDAGYPPAAVGPPPGGNYGGGFGWTPSQVEDHFIEMCRQVQAVSPNGPVYFLTWFHPLYWPQVVNKSSDFAWANTTSAFKAKVDTWHNTSPNELTITADQLSLAGSQGFQLSGDHISDWGHPGEAVSVSVHADASTPAVLSARYVLALESNATSRRTLEVGVDSYQVDFPSNAATWSGATPTSIDLNTNIVLPAGDTVIRLEHAEADGSNWLDLYSFKIASNQPVSIVGAPPPPPPPDPGGQQIFGGEGAFVARSGTPDYTVGPDGTLQQIVDTQNLTNKIIRVPAGTYNVGEWILYKIDNDFGNCEIQCDPGVIFRTGQGVGLFGETRNFHWIGGVIEVDANHQFGNGLIIWGGTVGGHGGNGNGAYNLTVTDLEVRPYNGAYFQRGGVTIWAADCFSITGCHTHHGSANILDGNVGTAASGISIGTSRRYTGRSVAVQPQRVYVANNLIHHQNDFGGYGTSYDRNGIILDLWDTFGDYVLGDTVIRNNEIYDVDGKGISVHFAGRPGQSRTIVEYNYIHGAYCDNTIDNKCGIGGYADSDVTGIGHVENNNNIVETHSPHWAYEYREYVTVTGVDNVGVPNNFFQCGGDQSGWTA